MYYTYILSSIKQPGAIYKGFTKNLKLRLEEHNSLNGKRYSKKYSPWKLETYLAFSNIKQAKSFEKYLKSSSGNSFLKKRLISNSFKVALTKFNNARNSISETK